MRRGTPAYYRLTSWGQAMYVEFIGYVTVQYALVRITAEVSLPGWPVGSQHLVPVRKLTRRRRGRHAKPKWWR